MIRTSTLGLYHRNQRLQSPPGFTALTAPTAPMGGDRSVPAGQEVRAR
jgi:hypothetical protein